MDRTADRLTLPPVDKESARQGAQFWGRRVRASLKEAHRARLASLTCLLIEDARYGMVLADALEDQAAKQAVYAGTCGRLALER